MCVDKLTAVLAVLLLPVPRGLKPKLCVGDCKMASASIVVVDVIRDRDAPLKIEEFLGKLPAEW